jgi:hypothetical protein
VYFLTGISDFSQDHLRKASYTFPEKCHRCLGNVRESERHMYYRVAIRTNAFPDWKWKSTALRSLDTLLHWLRYYRFLPRDRLRIFSASSLIDLNEQLARENQGLPSTSVPAIQFLQERLIQSPEATRGTPERDESVDCRWQPSLMGAIAARSHPAGKENDRDGNGLLVGTGMCELEKRRLELERGPGGDHDVLYHVVLPSSASQVLAWMRLLVRNARGELHP